MARTTLPPGFRFHPTDIELVCYYLKRKIMGKPFHFDAIAEVELYKFAPWDLPEKAQMGSKDLEWYFLCPRDKKYSNGSRTNRTTEVGYWKATGKDRSVEYASRTIGMKKTLIFHVGKPPKGDRTDWVMYEYRLEDKEVSDAGFSQDAYVLCKIFQKSGMGPKIGEQYGAPFNEADWDDETIDGVSLPFISCSSSKIPPDPASSALVLPQPIISEFVEDPSCANPSDIDGLLMDDIVNLLSSPAENTNEKVYENNTVASNYDSMTKELDEGFAAQTAMLGANYFVPALQTEYSADSILAELCSNQYMELNDLSFLDDTDTFINEEYLLGQHAPDQSLLEQHAPAQSLLEQYPTEYRHSLYYLNYSAPPCNADATPSMSGPSCQESESHFNAASPNQQAAFFGDIWND